MQIQSTHRDFIKAVVLGDTRQAGELNDRVPESERRDFHVFVTAFFTLMLEQQFKDDASRDAIAKFVDEMRYDFRNAQPPIQPLVVEALLRASCGEEHLFDEISPEDSFRAEFQVITKVTHEKPTVKKRIDDFLSDAELLASQWDAEDTE